MRAAAQRALLLIWTCAAACAEDLPPPECRADLDCPTAFICAAQGQCVEDRAGEAWRALAAQRTESCRRDEDCANGRICDGLRCVISERCADGAIRQRVERCDGKDNNCDGETDEGFRLGEEPCTVGFGECAATGMTTCSRSGLGTVCSAKPSTPELERCDDKDNDCDNAIDENFVHLHQLCWEGTGKCLTPGFWECSRFGTTECTAVPAAPDPYERCGNSIDDDCDGETDEGFFDLGQLCWMGVGDCATRGVLVCEPSDLRSTTCVAVPRLPVAETCDMADNDCDGVVDRIVEPCASACNRGVRICVDGTWSPCSAKLPGDVEIENNKDDDCDGIIDNGFTPVPIHAEP